MTTVVYNYKGEAVTLGDFVIPAGGPYPVADVFEERCIVVDSTGSLHPSDAFVPNYGAYFSQGLEVGLTCAGFILMVWIVKLLKGPR